MGCGSRRRSTSSWPPRGPVLLRAVSGWTVARSDAHVRSTAVDIEDKGPVEIDRPSRLSIAPDGLDPAPCATSSGRFGTYSQSTVIGGTAPSSVAAGSPLPVSYTHLRAH